MKLDVKNLSVERSGQIIFEAVSFDLSSGEALILTGANGSGKSTLLRAISGLLRPTSGEVSIEGHNQEEDDPAPHEFMHFLGHNNALKHALSVGENLDFWQKFCGNPLHDIDDALAMVGLEGAAHLPAGYLSAGQKRRVSIARLLVSHKPIWIVDEPTAALDNTSEAMFAGLIEQHIDNDGLVVAATHQALGLDQQGQRTIKRLDLNSHLEQLQREMV